MSYLTETTMELQMPALRYDADKQEIAVGNRIFPVDVNLRETSPWNIVRYDDPNQLAESSVCMNVHSKLIGTPSFHQWLGSVMSDASLSEQVRSSTVDVLHSVFTTLEPEIEIPESDTRGPFGFNMLITPNRHANLYTLGSCACLHPHPEGQWVDYSEWSEGYCEYDWHNIDFDAQQWSLIAGMGHLACLAASKAQ